MLCIADSFHIYSLYGLLLVSKMLKLLTFDGCCCFSTERLAFYTTIRLSQMVLTIIMPESILKVKNGDKRLTRDIYGNGKVACNDKGHENPRVFISSNIPDDQKRLGKCKGE